MQPTVSIIVPIYNAEKYIRRCIDSILSQEYTDFELFLVNDGSTDASGAICDEYAARDARIRIIHKENTGVSDSRNTALAQARGVYLQFLDSDDWITPDATKLFVRAATERHCDLVISDFYRVVGERVSHKGDIEEDGVLTREEFAAHMMENPADFYYGVLWNKLYRRDIVEKYQLRMDTSISWCEDFMFNLEYILHANVFYALQAPIYYYVKTKGSLASQGMSISKTIKMKLMVFEYYDNFFKNVYDEKDYEKKRLQVYRFFLDAAGDGSVPPTILPNAKKLGDERSGICSEAVSGDGILMELYRSRKLLERYLETAALQSDLSLKEISLLFYLYHLDTPKSKKELSDFTGMSKNTLSRTLQKLNAKNLIRVTELRNKAGEQKKLLSIEFLPASDPILSGFTAVQDDFDSVRFDGFSDEERALYQRISAKIKDNVSRVLLP